jgi:Uma2 family endonuclease
MATAIETPSTLAEIWPHIAALHDIPYERIRIRPWPGQATEDDLLALAEAPRKCLCELIDGVLVEKPMGAPESHLTAELLTFLNNFNRLHRLGIFTVSDGMFRIAGGRVRLPDLAFVSWDRLPGRQRPTDAIWDVVPDLAVEVLSPGNTRGEMLHKRRDYFAAGVILVWEVDPPTQTVAVYSRADAADRVLGPQDTLDGGTVLPGFTLPLADLFAEWNRRG